MRYIITSDSDIINIVYENNPTFEGEYIMSSVNERFKKIRQDLGFNQQQFAFELGISRTHISGIENGKDNPSKSLLKFLCAKFSISEEWMLDGIGTPLPEWNMRTDKGAIAKYNALRASFEKMLLGATGEDLVCMIQAFCHLVGALDARKIDQQEAIAYRKALCSIVDELEKLTMMVSSDTVLPSKTDAMGWVEFKNSCSAATNRINQSVKDAVNVYLEKYGEEMKL